MGRHQDDQKVLDVGVADLSYLSCVEQCLDLLDKFLLVDEGLVTVRYMMRQCGARSDTSCLFFHYYQLSKDLTDVLLLDLIVVNRTI